MTAFTVALLFSALVLGKPTPRSFTVHERRDAAPTGFTLSGAANTDQTLSLRIGLTQGNLTGLYDALYEVSDPTSAKYGQHLSKDEVRAIKLAFVITNRVTPRSLPLWHLRRTVWQQ